MRTQLFHTFSLTQVFSTIPMRFLVRNITWKASGLTLKVKYIRINYLFLSLFVGGQVIQSQDFGFTG